MFAFYSYGGVELVSLAAGESASPHKSVPRAIRATFFRIVIFYILTILTIGLNINYQDPTLLTAAFGTNLPHAAHRNADCILQTQVSPRPPLPSSSNVPGLVPLRM